MFVPRIQRALKRPVIICCSTIIHIAFYLFLAYYMLRQELACLKASQNGTIIARSAKKTVRDGLGINGLVLHAYIAVSWIPNEGAGVGIVQQARLHELSRAQPHTQTVNHRIFYKEYVCGWHQKTAVAEGIQTSRQCHLKSLNYTLVNLRSLYRKGKNCEMPRKVMLHTKLSEVVKIIACYRDQHPGSKKKRCHHRLDEDDRRLVNQVLKGTRRLHELSPEIAIVVQTKSGDPVAAKAVTRAVILAGRRGRRA